MSKLTLLHINIIGVVVALLVGAGLYFTIITGAMDAKAKEETALAGVQERANKLSTAERALKQAKADKVLAERQWSAYETQYMPVIGYTKDRLTTWLKVFLPNKGRSWPERYIRTIRSHMASEQKANGIVWENPGAIVLPAYGPDPNTIDVGAQGEGFGPVLHYSYDFAVRARSLGKLMQHIRSWSSLRQGGVPVVDGLQISGNSPNLRATYTVTFTIVVRDKLPDAVGRISAQGGGQSGMGGMGMMGMMGGPPGAGMGRGRGGPMMGGMGGPPGMMSGPGGGMTPSMAAPAGQSAGGGGGAGLGGSAAAMSAN